MRSVDRIDRSNLGDTVKNSRRDSGSRVMKKFIKISKSSELNNKLVERLTKRNIPTKVAKFYAATKQANQDLLKSDQLSKKQKEILKTRKGSLPILRTQWVPIKKARNDDSGRLRPINDLRYKFYPKDGTDNLITKTDANGQLLAKVYETNPGFESTFKGFKWLHDMSYDELLAKRNLLFGSSEMGYTPRKNFNDPEINRHINHLKDARSKNTEDFKDGAFFIELYNLCRPKALEKFHIRHNNLFPELEISDSEKDNLEDSEIVNIDNNDDIDQLLFENVFNKAQSIIDFEDEEGLLKVIRSQEKAIFKVINELANKIKSTKKSKAQKTIIIKTNKEVDYPTYEELPDHIKLKSAKLFLSQLSSLTRLAIQFGYLGDHSDYLLAIKKFRKYDLLNPDYSEVNFLKPNGSQNDKRSASQSTNFSQLNLDDGFFPGANFAGTKIDSAKRANFEKADLSEVQAPKAKLQGSNLQLSKLGSANLTEANLTKANLSGADFKRKKGKAKTNLQEALLQTADLHAAKHFDKNNVSAIGAKYFETDFPASKEAEQLIEALNRLLQKGNIQISYDDNKQDESKEASPPKISFSLGSSSGIADDLGMIEDDKFRGDLSKLNFSGLNAPGSNWHYATLNGAQFQDANLRNANFHRTALEGSSFDRAQLEGANFNKALLNKASLRGAKLDSTNFSEANLSDANMNSSGSAQHANFDKANINGLILKDKNLYGASFRDIPPNKAFGVDLSNTNLTNADFTGTIALRNVQAKLPVNPEFLESQKTHGVNLHVVEFNKTKKAFGTGNLTTLPRDLSGSYFERANFDDLDLRGYDFSNAFLEACCFANCDLTRANFEGAIIKGCDFKGVSLAGANFKNAQIHGANRFDGADMSNADCQNIKINYVNTFDGVNMTGTNFEGADLSTVRDLEFHERNTVLCLMNIKGDGANFNRANLRGVLFKDSNFDNASFQDSYLEKTKLVYTGLLKADFSRAKLIETSFLSVSIRGANFTDIDQNSAIIQDSVDVRKDGIGLDPNIRVFEYHDVVDD